jgi:D-serine deaminase-like pyridoxal phosphate-dependent protein
LSPRLTDGGFSTPLAVLRDRRLRLNIATLQRWCDERGVALAPHVKTTMSPQVAKLQLDAGAWALTVANCTQAAAVLGLGPRRLLIANEVVDPSELAWLARTVSHEESPELFCYVDSIAGVELLSASLLRYRAQLGVLIEVGAHGGRAGARSLDQVASLARAIAARPGLVLRGVAGFEGVLAGDRSPGALQVVRDFCVLLKSAAALVGQARPGVSDAPLVISAGGSVFFDEVAATLNLGVREGTKPLVVLRSGGYAIHDHNYLGRLSPLQGPDECLGPALEVHGRVVSMPDDSLAIVNVGKRDIGSDLGLPTVVGVANPDWSPRSPTPRLWVEQLNDQHAYLRRDGGAVPEVLSVSDIVVFGVSHPCSTFDKWRAVPILDEDDRLVDIAHTFF